MNTERTRRGAQTEAWLTTYRTHEISGRRRCVYIALGPESDDLENGFIFDARAGYDNAQVWAGRFEGGHHIEEILARAVAEQHQINVLPRSDLG